MTPEPSGHCLLSSPEPLSGGINPFLTPVLRLGEVWYPREGTVSGGASRLHGAHSNHATEAHWGSWVPGARDRRHWQRFLLVSSAAPEGPPCPSQSPLRRSTNYHPNSVTNMSLSRPAQHALCPLSTPNLMPTPCQFSQQCQAGTGVTKPVGVCVVVCV